MSTCEGTEHSNHEGIGSLHPDCCSACPQRPWGEKEPGNLNCPNQSDEGADDDFDPASDHAEQRNHANGLENLLRWERPKSLGILNGIDTEVWYTKTDALLETNYTLKDFKKGKGVLMLSNGEYIEG